MHLSHDLRQVVAISQVGDIVDFFFKISTLMAIASIPWFDRPLFDPPKTRSVPVGKVLATAFQRLKSLQLEISDRFFVGAFVWMFFCWGRLIRR